MKKSKLKRLNTKKTAKFFSFFLSSEVDYISLKNKYKGKWRIKQQGKNFEAYY